MKTKLNCILLIDDDENCNLFHKILFQDMNVADHIEIATDGKKGLEYLITQKDGSFPQPAIIFLDINMPVMDGWEFLDEYDKLNEEQKARIVLVMLTTSLNPDDKEKALNKRYVNDFQNKFLDEDRVMDIIQKHFSDQI